MSNVEIRIDRYFNAPVLSGDTSYAGLQNEVSWIPETPRTSGYIVPEVNSNVFGSNHVCVRH